MWDTRHRTQDAGGRGPGWWALWVVLLPCAFWNPCAKAAEAPPSAAEQMMPVEQVAMKTVTGTVVTVTKRAISVEYDAGKDIYEMLLPFGKEMKLEQVRNVNELKRGDTVTVGYRQTYRADEQRGQVILGTVATSIALMKSATGELRSAQ